MQAERARKISGDSRVAAGSVRAERLHRKKSFWLEYSQCMGSIEAAYISISRYMLENWRDLTWFPLWYGGIPFQNTYPPLLHALVAGFAAVAGVSPARAHHAVTAMFYCLGPVAVYFLALRLTSSRWFSFWAGLVYSVLSPVGFLDAFHPSGSRHLLDASAIARSDDLRRRSAHRGAYVPAAGGARAGLGARQTHARGLSGRGSQHGRRGSHELAGFFRAGLGRGRLLGCDFLEWRRLRLAQALVHNRPASRCSPTSLRPPGSLPLPSATSDTTRNTSVPISMCTSSPCST